MSDAKSSQPPNLPEHRKDLANGRDEMNLAEFPLACLATNGPKGAKTLVFEDRIRDSGTGQDVTRRLTVMGSEKFGLPTPVDDDVLVVLLHLTKATNNFTNRTVPFSRYALIELFGWQHSGQNYDRLEQAFLRLASVTLHYEKAWWDKEEKAWVDEVFHILEGVTIHDADSRKRRKQARPDAPLPLSSFTWNEVIFRSFQAENLKRLDLNLYLRLDLAPAKRMLRFLDKRFYRRSRLEFDLREFVCEHVGMSRNYDIGKIKEKLRPSLEELEGIGFIERLSNDERYVQVRRGCWKVVFIKPAPQLKPAENERGFSDLEKALVDRGVSPAKAVALIATHPADRVAAKVEVFDWLAENSDKRVSLNPAGYLVKSIEEDWNAPKGFETRVERETKKKAVIDKKAREQVAKREAEEQEKTAAVEQRRQVDQFLASLPPAERETFEASAVARSSVGKFYHSAKATGGERFDMWRYAILGRAIQERQVDRAESA